MSNHLGQIYSTTKNAEKYIVLNSQNVELSGNVKLTNGNLDVSNNLIFNTFSVGDKISFKETSNSTSYNIINDNLTSNNDASFNNVDISGNLKLGLGNLYETKNSSNINTLVLDFSNTKINITETNSVSSINNNNLVIQTNPTTQAIEFRTSQIYPETNNATMLGGASNRWSTGHFENINAGNILNPNGRIGIGPQLWAYPRFNVGGENGWNEAYLTNVMNNAYYFRIAGHPSYQGAMHFHANGNITCNTSFTPASDDRLKHNESTITNALHLIRQLVPKKYQKTETMLSADYNGTLPKGMNYMVEAGFIAQEVQKIPDLSFAVNGGDYEDEKEDGTKEIKAHPFNLNYDTIFTYVTAAVQELDNLVQNKENRINNLEAENTLLKSKLNELLSEAGKPTI